MIIPLGVGDIAGAKRAYLSFSLRCNRFRCSLNAKAIIDTGSPYYLILSYKEALRAQFPITKSTDTEIIPLGGGKIEAHRVNGAQMSFVEEKGAVVRLNPSTVYFSESTSKKEEREGEVYLMPNLLGVDFLELNNYKFVFHPTKDKAYLEKEE